MGTRLRSALAGVAGLAFAASTALAQQAPPQATSLRMSPDAAVTVPGGPVRGFDAPKPNLTLKAPGDEAAIRGLAPGQDLVGSAQPGIRRPSAAETDSYFASQEYPQKAETIERKGHQGVGKQFAGAGEAAAANLVIGGVGSLITGN